MSTVSGNDSVYRRFDPSNKDHYSLDQGIGTYRLRSGALPFECDEHLPDELAGCSAYLHSILEALGLGPQDCSEPSHPAVAVVPVGGLRGIATGSESVDVRADPYPDTGDPDWKQRDLSHGLITMSTSLSKKRKRRLITRLALEFEVVVTG